MCFVFVPHTHEGFMLLCLCFCCWLGGQATELLGQWAPIAVEDALGLLLPEFPHTSVREYAVATLGRAPDEDLVNYLLQVCVFVFVCSCMSRVCASCKVACVASLFHVSADCCVASDDIACTPM